SMMTRTGAALMNRRNFLTTSGMAALGFGLGGCATHTKPNVAPRRPTVKLAPVHASWDRIVRTTVGLRPHRDSGFVLKADRLDVTIYALAVPPNVTSNMSLAGFTPSSGLVETDRRTPEWDAQYRRAGDIAYRQLQLLVGPRFGVSWLDNYSLSDTLPSPPADNP